MKDICYQMRERGMTFEEAESRIKEMKMIYIFPLHAHKSTGTMSSAAWPTTEQTKTGASEYSEIH